MPQLHQNYIAGAWTSGTSEVENRNPSDLSDVIGLFTQASNDQLEVTLDRAAAAQAEWAAYAMERKQTILMAIGNELMARAEELGRLLSREEGKPLAEGKGEVYRAGQFFTYYAAECLRQLGENADSVRDGVEIDVRREPVGVVAVISPWNFPNRHRLMENRAGAVLRQCRSLEACQYHTRLGCGPDGSYRASGHPKGAFQPCHGLWPRGRAAPGGKPQGQRNFLYRVGPSRQGDRRHRHREPDKGADGNGLQKRPCGHG